MKADKSPRMSRQENSHAKYLFDIFIYLPLVVFCAIYLTLVRSLYLIYKIRYELNIKDRKILIFIIVIINSYRIKILFSYFF